MSLQGNQPFFGLLLWQLTVAFRAIATSHLDFKFPIRERETEIAGLERDLINVANINNDTGLKYSITKRNWINVTLVNDPLYISALCVCISICKKKEKVIM